MIDRMHAGSSIDGMHRAPGGVVMPDGDGGLCLAPAVLTEAELIRFLRLDEPGGPKDPGQTVRYYRDRAKLLRGCKIGNRILYPLTEALRFLALKVATDAANTHF